MTLESDSFHYLLLQNTSVDFLLVFVSSECWDAFLVAPALTCVDFSKRHTHHQSLKGAKHERRWQESIGQRQQRLEHQTEVWINSKLILLFPS